MNDNGWVVWEESTPPNDGDPFANDQIFLYTGSGPAQNISNNTWNNTDPQINNNGWVVWDAWDPVNVLDYVHLYQGPGQPQSIWGNFYDLDMNSRISNNGWVSLYEGDLHTPLHPIYREYILSKFRGSFSRSPAAMHMIMKSTTTVG